MATAQQLLSIARGEVGYCRWDDPQQGTKYGRWYGEFTGSPWFGTNGVPYCAMFVSWCLHEAGVSCEGFPRAVAIDRRDGFSRVVEPTALKAGDVVGFDWDGDAGGDHVGIFDRWLDEGWQFATIEGNTGNGEVAERTRYVTQVTCGVRPYYDESTDPAKDARQLSVDGAVGPATIREWQRQMGMGECDGVLSGQLESEDAYRRTVWSIDREGNGSALVLAVQRRLQGKGLYDGWLDGRWGRATTCAIQKQLKAWGYYTGGIDGDFGHHSAESLQRSLNDGRWAQ